MEIEAMYRFETRFPEGWRCSQEEVVEMGMRSCHLEASCGSDSIEAYAGAMPPGESAEDQALYNYAEMVGFDENDETSPVLVWKFQGRRAFGFDCLDEDGSSIRVICLEPRAGVLLVVCLYAADDDALESLFKLAENAMRVGR